MQGSVMVRCECVGLPLVPRVQPSLWPLSEAVEPRNKMGGPSSVLGSE